MFGGDRGELRNRSEFQQFQSMQIEGIRKQQTTILVLDAQLLKQIRMQVQEGQRILQCSNKLITASNCQLTTVQKTMMIDLYIKTIAKQQHLTQLFKKYQQVMNQRSKDPRYIQMRRQNERITKIHDKVDQKISRLRAANQRHYQQEFTMAHFTELKVRFEEQIKQLQADIVQDQQQIKEKQRQIQIAYIKQKELQRQLRQVFEQKKINNNYLQETKGNVRVYCRLRPCESTAEKIDYQVTQDMLKVRKDRKQLKSVNLKMQFDYLFEKVFRQDVTQEILFEQLSELVQCSVDGNNVCIFAYGQTGSGKTYTMNGNLDVVQWNERGFIPRSIEYIFNQVDIGKTRGYQCKVSISVSQIYNDRLIDLLRKQDNRSRSHDSKKQLGGQKKSLDLTYTQIHGVTQGLILLKQALNLRATANTNMNIQSSRSHLIFEIRNQFENKEMDIDRMSSLVLVDLAGSQRQKDSGVTGARFDEAKQINKSLTELGKVMRAIKDGQQPSFRSSRLTSVLQKYLEGDSKAVMFVNVSTDKADLDQSLNSLNFAESVKQCQLKNARKSQTQA